MLKRVKHSAEIDLARWHDDDNDKLDPALKRAYDAMTKILRKRFASFEDENDDEASARNHPYFPYEWSKKDGIGGDPPDDPLTIYIGLPLADQMDDGSVWSLTVTECVNALINHLEDDVNSQTLKINHPENAILIRDALRAAAQRIDDTLSQEWVPVADTKE